jgi:surface antigen
MSKMHGQMSIAISLTLSITLGGCMHTTGGVTAEASSSNGSGWELDRVSQSCLGTMVMGTIAGAAVGALTNGGKGAIVGGVSGMAVGGLACSVIVALDQEDKNRIRAAELDAARSGRPVDLNYTGADGTPRNIHVAPKPETRFAIDSTATNSIPANTGSENSRASRICRPLDSTITISTAGTTSLPTQLVCRTPDGDWVPQDKGAMDVASTK